MTHLRIALLLWAMITIVGCGQSSVAPWVPILADSTASAPASDVKKLVASEQEPRQHTANKPVVNKPVVQDNQSGIPRVFLSGGHAKLCRIGVGDTFPAVELPRLGGQATRLATLYGKQATVVLFWHPDRWMARAALADLARDVVKQADLEQVSVVGIAVGQPAGAVQAMLDRAQASFPQLLDTNSSALAEVGTIALPRIYVLDAQGKIVWFDIEYSEATRRELQQTLDVLTSDKKLLTAEEQ